MKRVLVITYYWPPTGGSGVQRWVKFAKYLPAEGWEPVIYTPDNPEMTAIDRTLKVPEGIEVIKRPIREPYNIYRKLMGRGASTDMKTLTAGKVYSGKGTDKAKVYSGNGTDKAKVYSGKGTDKATVYSGKGTDKATVDSHASPATTDTPLAAGSKEAVTPISSGRKTFKQRLSLWIRANLFVPDPRVGWVKPSVRFLKKYLKEHPVDVIVTTGPPQSMHLIGQKLHKELDIPWIPDFRDPWTRMYYLKHLPLTKRSWKRLQRMEQSVLDECSTVLTVTPLVQEDYKARTKTPVAMITNGYDAEDFQGPAPQPDGLFNITHTGLLAADGNPITLWQTLGEMACADITFRERMRIRLIGRVDKEVYDEIDKAGIRDNVVDLGYKAHAETVAEQRAASVLILPLRNDPDYAIILPGKLFEYLASSRPILGIGQPDGAMARVLQDTGCGITADWNDPATMRAFFQSEWEAYCKCAQEAPEQCDQEAQKQNEPGQSEPAKVRFGKVRSCGAIRPGVEQYSRKNITRQLAQLLNEQCR